MKTRNYDISASTKILCVDNFEMCLLYKYIYTNNGKISQQYFIMYKHAKFENINACTKISGIFLFMNHIA